MAYKPEQENVYRGPKPRDGAHAAAQPQWTGKDCGLGSPSGQ